MAAALMFSRTDSDSTAVKKALQDAYASRALRGAQFNVARRLIERRERFGRNLKKHAARSAPASNLTVPALVRTYQKEVARQKQMVRKAEFAQQRLLFVTGALHQLFADEHFVTLLRAEGLDSVPRYLAERLP
jgi:ParB family chromosome partitioning protein